MDAETLNLLLLLGVAGVAGVAGVFLAQMTPRLLFVIWIVCLFFLPIWLGVQLGVFFSGVTVISLLIIAAGDWLSVSLSPADFLVLGFALLVVLACGFGWSTWGHGSIVLVGWIIPYLAGRVLLSKISLNWMYSSIAVAATVAAFLAIIEFATGTNFFVLLHANNGLFSTWGPLQFRGGLLRAEGAFGHSIALGAVLAMSSVFVLSTKWSIWIRLSMLGIVAVGTGITFSRIGLIGLAITTVTGLLFLRNEISRWARVATTAVLLLVAAAGIPRLLAVFSDAGQEASGSAEYRSDLLVLLRDVVPLGITPSWNVLPNGETYYGSFQSVDSEVVLTALRFGYLPLLFLFGGLVLCLLSVFRGNATPPSIALLGQIPGFATVALITQYATFVWFIAGLAVAIASLKRSPPKDPLLHDDSPAPHQQEIA